MHKGRLEAFTDAIIAIIMTLMVLELKVPSGFEWRSLLPLAPNFAYHTLSFVFLAIYWNNHHHMMQAVKAIDGRVLWANNHLLFWLSLIPFATSWVGEGCFAPAPVALYGIDLLLCAIAYTILTRALLAANGANSEFAKGLGGDRKGNISMAVYALGIAFAWLQPYVSCCLYLIVAIMWFIPDRRFVAAAKSNEVEST